MENWFNPITLICLFPIMFMLHDFEEIIMVEKWIKNNSSMISSKLPPKLANRLMKQFSLTTAQFSVSVLIIFILVSSSTYMALQYINQGPLANIHFFIVCNLVFFLHLFTHVIQSIYFRSVTPGAFTSIVIILPYSLLLFSSLLENHVVGWNIVIQCLPFIFLVIPIVLLAHKIGKKLV